MPNLHLALPSPGGTEVTADSPHHSVQSQEEGEEIPEEESRLADTPTQVGVVRRPPEPDKDLDPKMKVKLDKSRVLAHSHTGLLTFYLLRKQNVWTEHTHTTNGHWKGVVLHKSKGETLR